MSIGTLKSRLYRSSQRAAQVASLKQNFSLGRELYTKFTLGNNLTWNTSSNSPSQQQHRNSRTNNRHESCRLQARCRTREHRRRISSLRWRSRSHAHTNGTILRTNRLTRRHGNNTRTIGWDNRLAHDRHFSWLGLGRLGNGDLAQCDNLRLVDLRCNRLGPRNHWNGWSRLSRYRDDRRRLSRRRSNWSGSSHVVALRTRDGDSDGLDALAASLLTNLCRNVPAIRRRRGRLARCGCCHGRVSYSERSGFGRVSSLADIHVRSRVGGCDGSQGLVLFTTTVDRRRSGVWVDGSNWCEGRKIRVVVLLD
jgi:hypothetical protein